MKGKDRSFLVGRSTECDIVLADPSVSRRHAELIQTAQGQWLLIDRRSQNGTTVESGNGGSRAIRQEVITSADTIRFGDVRITAAELFQKVREQSGIPAENAAGEGPGRGSAKAAVARSGAVSGSAAASTPWVRGKQLVRCDCGTVKPRGGRCPVCRE